MNAIQYSVINDLQIQYGKSFALSAKIQSGDKVLDMGCGTGELTSFLAETTGIKEGLVVGVDPDVERIKVAIQKHSGTQESIVFQPGDSSSQFPHFNEQYYDIHFSNFVFQWLNDEEKQIFAQTAFKCLRPGGKIAIQSQEDDADIVKKAVDLFFEDKEKANPQVPVYYVKKSDAEALLRKSGFVVVTSEYYQRSYTFPSADEFFSFFCASDYYDATSISSINKTKFFDQIVNPDKTVTVFAPNVYQIIAEKMS
ncbi:phosphomethylethanolamine N-methyltransferase-like [Dendronephthya gigantea]|uniref:phosphomethylethanolamine N-methyltransferase-like n=1 Tax=Dendronephthya gigantea TaxID=151771 RepID=UPI00106D272C|nr:phosphomethylethanolamine N-methyltransferase-like [Dendronephthya gigantea]